MNPLTSPKGYFTVIPSVYHFVSRSSVFSASNNFEMLFKGLLERDLFGEQRRLGNVDKTPTVGLHGDVCWGSPWEVYVMLYYVYVELTKETSTHCSTRTDGFINSKSTWKSTVR